VRIQRHVLVRQCLVQGIPKILREIAHRRNQASPGAVIPIVTRLHASPRRIAKVPGIAARFKDNNAAIRSQFHANHLVHTMQLPCPPAYDPATIKDEHA
jgi:hypothetical protein